MIPRATFFFWGGVEKIVLSARPSRPTPRSFFFHLIGSRSRINLHGWSGEKEVRPAFLAEHWPKKFATFDRRWPKYVLVGRDKTQDPLLELQNLGRNVPENLSRSFDPKHSFLTIYSLMSNANQVINETRHRSVDHVPVCLPVVTIFFSNLLYIGNHSKSSENKKDCQRNNWTKSDHVNHMSAFIFHP